MIDREGAITPFEFPAENVLNTMLHCSQPFAEFAGKKQQQTKYSFGSVNFLSNILIRGKHLVSLLIIKLSPCRECPFRIM